MSRVSDSPERRPKRGASLWIRRIAVAALLLAAGVEVLWIVAARMALTGGALRSVLNAHPEELFADWKSAVSWIPGRIRLEGFSIRGQDDQDQWHGEAEHADLEVRLGPLLRKEIEGTKVHLRGVVFRLRPRLDFVEAGSVDPVRLPEIPGYENPPQVAPPKSAASGPDSGSHWALRLTDIRVDDLREVWVNELRLRGGGLVRGRMDYELGGPFEVELFELSIPSAEIGRGESVAATRMAVSAAGTLGPLRFSECKGAEYFRRTSLRLGLKGRVETGEILSRHLGRTDSLELQGSGELEAEFVVRKGVLQESSRVELLSPALTVRLGDVLVRGDSEVRVAVSSGVGESRPVSTLSAAVKRLRVRHRDLEAGAEEFGDLKLRAIAHDPEVPDGFKEVEVDLQVGPMRLPDARILNGFIPTQTAGVFLGGAFEVSAQYARAREGTGEGILRLGGRDLDFKLGTRDYRGIVGVDAAFRLATNGLVTLDPSAVWATNVQVSGIRARQADGWHARLEVERGTLSTSGPTDLGVDLRLQLLDTRPLIALLREDEESPRWVRLMPTLKNLAGSAKVRLASTNLVIRDLHLRGSATEVMAQLILREGVPDGIAYARYGLVAVGLDFRGGESDWTMLGAKRKYRRALADLQLEGALAPDEAEVQDVPEGSGGREGRERAVPAP
jgi:hypothetical protein